MQVNSAHQSPTAAAVQALPTFLDQHGRTLLTAALSVIVVAALAFKLRLVFTLNVNWDEFYYLHWLYLFLRGELSNQFQTFHVHFFTWLPGISRNEVDQVIAARLVVYILSIGSSAFTYLIARNFFDRLCSLFVLSCYLSFSVIVAHGTSFRVDPIAAFFFLGAVYLLIRPGSAWFGPIIAGAAIALAIMMTIKSAFYLPVFGAMLLIEFLDRERRPEALRRVMAFGGTFILTLMALYGLHEATLSAPTFDDATGFVATSADKVIRLNEFFPRWRYFLRSLIEDAALWGIFLFGVVCLLRDAFRNQLRPERRVLYLATFLLPLATLIFYRNAFPYFYVFVLSPAVLVCGIALERLLAIRTDKSGQRTPWLVVGLLVIAVATNFFQENLSGAMDRTRAQRQTVELVHKLFPEPVPYFDRTTMIASFPDVGFFMSSWGIEGYLERNEPVFRTIIEEKRPPFYIADIELLDPRIEQTSFRDLGIALLPDDYAAIEENYVHHWGDLYVAGKTLRFADGGETLMFDMLIPGLYTIEAPAPLEIDGVAVPPGRAIELNKGSHRARLQTGIGGEVTLRWGNHLYRPDDPPTDVTFTGF